MNVCAATMGKLEDWLEVVPSKNTRKSYIYGVSVFETWYGDSITKLIKSPEATRTIERFYVYLRERHPQNTCRNITNAAIQFLKFHRTEVRPRRSLGIYNTERALGKHLVTISEVQKMVDVANLDEQTMLGIFILGFRVGDAIRLKKSDFENLLDRRPPIELRLRARKERTVYETYISEELRDLLKQYLPSLESEWIFPGVRKGSHVKDETLNKRLRSLAERAGVKLNGRLTWHSARNLILREGSQLGINAWNLKRITGKTIPISDDTYLAGLNLREDFIKLSRVLKLKPTRINNKVGNLEEIIEKIGMAMGKKLAKDAVELLKQEGVLGLQTKELDPLKDWLKIIENYIVFDEATLNPPTPNRDRRKKREVMKGYRQPKFL